MHCGRRRLGLLGSVVDDVGVRRRRCSTDRRSTHSCKQTRELASFQVIVTMGLVSFTKVILPSLAAAGLVSYVFWDLTRNRKIFGGTVLHTIQNSEWEKETDRNMNAWQREAAGPVAMNPISRQNYRKVTRD